MNSTVNDDSRHVLIDRDDQLYQAYVDVALTPSGKLVCVWRESDAHAVSNISRLVMRESVDLGASWSERRILDDGSTIEWLISNIACLRDGRLVVNACTTAHGDGYLFWSDDEGATWSPPRPAGVQGIALRRIVELDDGTLLQSLTEQFPRQRHWRNAGRTVLARSADGGASWRKVSVVAESDVLALCEAPIVKLHDGTLVCYFREDSGLHYPTFKAYSYDNGDTWSEPQETGVFGYQLNASVLKDSRVLLTYLNVGGNCGACAWCGDGYDPTGAQASACERDDGSATLTADGLRIKTDGDPNARPPYFLLHPAESDQSTILFEARLKCLANATGDACTLNVIEAGELRFYPDRVDLVHDPLPHKPKPAVAWGRNAEVVASFPVDASRFHTYRVVRGPDRTLTIDVDGVRRIATTKVMQTRPAGFGACMHDFNCFGTTAHVPGQESVRHAVTPQETRGESFWRFVRLRIENPTLPAHHYAWHAASGEYPNQYERDHVLEIVYDPSGDSGEPHTVELPDGRVYCVYHTAAAAERMFHPAAGTNARGKVESFPYIMGCHLELSDLP